MEQPPTTPAADFPETTPAALRRAAATWPDLPAIVDGQWSDPLELTWTQLHDAVRGFAASLAASGIGAGDRVALWSPNSFHWPIAALGVHYAGATLVPLNTRYTAGEAIEIITRSKAKAVVVSGEFLGTDHLADLLRDHADALPRVIVHVPLAPSASPAPAVSWGEVLARATDENLAEADRRADSVSPEDISDILFTSGTTGKSKGVLATHRQTVAGSHAWGANGRLHPGERYLMVNPYFHTFGYKAGILPCVLFGVTMLPLAVYSPPAAMELAADQRATIFPGAPTIFQTILDAPDRAEFDLSSLRLVVTGAAIVPVVLVERIQRDLGVDTVITAYGLTECSGFVSTCTPDDDDETVANTCGRAFDGMEIRLSDEGEVLARGKMVMAGYLDDPDATAATIDADGWLHTGDIGTLDEHGNLKITDRLKDMYICGGFNVYPAEIEQTLARLDGVTESAVVGVPDERLGEVGRAYLTLRDGADLDEERVIAYAREHLANFKVPRSVVFVEAFPRNAAGKILKRELT
ncbi:AMP-dependent synthetase and ligase [Gordonia bronchialis DSM 43247]|uniref:AMP-dependent synthetase and ligase n=1 Tax=Gordonia bronchialis (strain ATCC 25592 / DSM 43247 / BCRC 13721 / JCM 3198 / KCTC 3076 / NBRC 16047 / NCTC 10667) TaxID=526226 RepID=D0L414_GORB4|nr:FadD3 family acyl-CoA ligase [Gordonia bronchialis]ACY23167.1 AMP-dependent synthetase and ligase [Gordonia bronchialis DSM 43247]MCC3325951.1 FadD3 family acyl-CoA ligase [Gordonia bronchialis]QGS23426.1 AMP-binding protein [Gordonia bronchialis]STQ66130.1 Long-chain-fatty-acid--CoA ligase [Gordonia bronchialis]